VDSRTDGRPRRTGNDKADVKNMLIREMKGSKAFSESLSEYQLKFQRRNRMDLILIIIVLLLIFGAVLAIPGGDMAAGSGSAVFC
jgi:hypothetical protein